MIFYRKNLNFTSKLLQFVNKNMFHIHHSLSKINFIATQKGNIHNVRVNTRPIEQWCNGLGFNFISIRIHSNSL